MLGAGLLLDTRDAGALLGVGEAGMDSGASVSGISGFVALVVKDLDIVLVALCEHGDIINVACFVDMAQVPLQITAGGFVPQILGSSARSDR